MDLEEYINYSEEKNISRILNPETAEDNEEGDKEDDSIELPQVSHKEASDAIHLLKLYLMQQDLSNVAHTEHDTALLKLSGLVRKLQNASFKQLTIETFFKSAM
ncbi:12193_t:CDS:2 [Racocetra fulgida]|uniref:12193_t:CDS:1 n=1 Tax=Racocetra fulgida TaxID=60492 RepID=A0A9N9A7T4_9GLOM|nr:12193_t:CDS:2 [Racocetra fulgida]